MTATAETSAGSRGSQPPVPDGAVTVTVKIRRFNPEFDDEPRWDSFDIPALPSYLVLNLLHYINW